MATISKAKIIPIEEPVCQGDIYKNVKYNYIDSESDDGKVNIIEYEFPYAIVISQACDVIAMDEMMAQKSGKPAKFMPSILLCPIYDAETAKNGQHILEAFNELNLKREGKDPVYQGDDLKVAKRDWNYRFHYLTVETDGKKVLENQLLDFKHYFTVPISYLRANKGNRVYHLEDLFAEQITLKFATYLSRVAIP